MKSQSRVLTEYFMALMNNSFRAANIRVIADKKNNSALMKSLCPMKTAKTYEPSSWWPYAVKIKTHVMP